MIRVKSAAAPQVPLAPLPAGGDPCGSPPAPGLPTTWTGPALGQAPAISPDAAALVGYTSPNESRPADGELEEDPELSRLRGTSQVDEEVRRLTIWTTRKDYPTTVGIALPIQDWIGSDFHVIQFWEELSDPIPVVGNCPDDDEGRAYAGALQELWLWKLRQLSPRIAAECGALGQDFSYKMRYQGNSIKVWYTPTAHLVGGLDEPLAEAPISKDKWYTDDVIALSYPPMPDQFAQQSADILFGGRLQERYPDPEVQGCKTALIASNNNIVQKPPNSLDRMHASLPKQVSYDQRVLHAEDEIAGINCDVGEFLSQMSSDEQIIICVNAGASLKRHEQHLGGQLWLQSDRHMTATNIQATRSTNSYLSAYADSPPIRPGLR
jgi:hypothetical protein